MNDRRIVIGWCDSYGSVYKTSIFTKEKRIALIERIRQRGYQFNHSDHQFLSYCAPFFDDNTICVLDKQEWDSVIKEAYKDRPIGARLLPMDVITREPVKGIIFEKEKLELEWRSKNV